MVPIKQKKGNVTLETRDISKEIKEPEPLYWCDVLSILLLVLLLAGECLGLEMP